MAIDRAAQAHRLVLLSTAQPAGFLPVAIGAWLHRQAANPPDPPCHRTGTELVDRHRRRLFVHLQASCAQSRRRPPLLLLFVRSCAPIHPTAHIPTTPTRPNPAEYPELTVTPCVRRRYSAAGHIAARPLPSLLVQSPLHITADVGDQGRRATPTRPAAGFDSRRSVRWQLRCERRALAPACEVDVDPKVGSASTQRRATGRKVPNLTLGATKIVDAYCPSGCVCYL